MGKIKGKLSTKERSKRYREKKAEEEGDQCKEKDKLRKAKKISMMTEEELAIHRKQDKDRKARKRKEIEEKAQMEKEEEEREYEKDLAEFFRDVSRERRSKMSDVKREYERIEQLIRNRKVRAERNGKEHLLDKLKAKKGMQLLKDEGRIEKYDPRFYYKRTELEIWRRYREIGPEYKEWLGVKNPDISKIFDEVDARQRKEKEDEEQKKKEEEKQMKKKEEEKDKKKEDGNDNENDSDEPDGYWGVQDGDYYWYGNGNPPPADEVLPLPTWDYEPTEEEEKQMKEKKEKEYEHYFKMLSEERKKEDQEREREKIIKRRECQKRYREKKRALRDKKVEMPQVGEKSAYQLLQEKNIEELEQRKKASGLFDDDN